jgi:hypothetical protein
MPSVDVAYGQTRGGTPEETLGETTQVVPYNNPVSPNPFNNDLANWDRINPQDLDLIMRAAETGAQNVFDPAMIGSLLKTNRVQAQVDDIMPDLVTALDKLCRLLLLFYWHNNEFAENYGADEMAEFEEVLQDSIKRMGTMVLFLKQRAEESPSANIDALSE